MAHRGDGEKRRASGPFGRRRADDAEFCRAVPLDEDGNPCEVDRADKVKGAAEMAAGVAVTAVGIPMLVLPGPGTLAVLGGAALTLKGHRTMTGREELPIEKTVDEAAARVAEEAKAAAKAAGDRAADEVGKAAAKVRERGPEFVSDAVRNAPEAVASAAAQAPKVASDIASAAARGASAAATVGSGLAKLGANAIKGKGMRK